MLAPITHLHSLSSPFSPSVSYSSSSSSPQTQLRHVPIYPQHSPRFPTNPSSKSTSHISPVPRTTASSTKYWSASSDSRLDANRDLRSSISRSGSSKLEFPPYPENPLIKQYSAEYWLLGDLMTPEESRGAESVSRRVFNVQDADVVFVPFLATLSAEMQLATGKAVLGKRKDENEDYVRQREVVDFVRGTEALKWAGGTDHVFVLTDPVTMCHVRAEIAPETLLVVDFGGWFRLDTKASDGNTSDMIQHTQVSLLKDVIVRLHTSTS